MTYYELVSFLDTLITSPKDNKNINKLNNITISLEGDKYIRFLNQLNYTLNQRFKIFFDNILTKMSDSYMDSKKLTLELSELKNEASYAINLTNINLVKNENKSEFYKSIIKTNNNIINKICEFFNDEERIMICKSYLIKED